MKVYVDGSPNPVHVRRDNLTGSVASAEPWRIAWKGTGVGFDGGIDEFRLYDRRAVGREVRRAALVRYLEGALAIAAR